MIAYRGQRIPDDFLPWASKMGQRDIRRLLIIGAMGVIRWTIRTGPAEGSWVARLLARKPRLVVAIALANCMSKS